MKHVDAKNNATLSFYPYTDHVIGLDKANAGSTDGPQFFAKTIKMSDKFGRVFQKLVLYKNALTGGCWEHKNFKYRG